jgi:hypothetical protein
VPLTSRMLRFLNKYLYMTLNIHHNFLSPLSFQFGVGKLDVFNQLVTAVNLPGWSVGSVPVGTPFVVMPVPGDHAKFDSMRVNFNVDELFKSYMEIYTWMIQIGKPDRFEQRPTDMREVYSDGFINILDSAKNAIFQAKVIDMFPVSLGQLQFDSQSLDNNPITSTVEFTYRKFVVEEI